MHNLTVCQVYNKMRELAETQQPIQTSVNIPTLARAFNTPETLIREFVQALQILDYVKGVEGDRVLL